MHSRDSSPNPAPYQTWDYNKWKDPIYTSQLGQQISRATLYDAIRRRGLPQFATGRFSTIQDRLIMAPRGYMLQKTAMLSADQAMAAIKAQQAGR